jgi:hypothetical protein
VNGAKVQIGTPVGAIGLRGTTVWGGPIDNGYGVIVLSGEVTVTGRRGTVAPETGPRHDALRRRPTSAGSRVARRSHEARGRLHHLRKSARSTVGEVLGLVRPSRDKLAEMRADAPSVR